MYPRTRMRRLRRTEGLRKLAAETLPAASKLILPLFVVPGRGRRELVESMPGVERVSVDLLKRRAKGLKSGAVLLFGVPDVRDKDEVATTATRDGGLVPAAIAALKKERPDVVVITDVCVCGYTTHGHCGILAASGEIDNDESARLLAAMSVCHARAGADVVAPSAMMDGQVKAIRDALDAEGFEGTAIMSYAAKFASSFYGPFREAAHSAPAFGDRRSYQLPPANRREAVRDALLDEAEGADWLMVKPALAYLDVIMELGAATRLPIAAYQVSGEYSMIKFAAAAGALDERAAAVESVTAMFRAGADAVDTYYAEQLARWLA